MDQLVRFQVFVQYGVYCHIDLPSDRLFEMTVHEFWCNIHSCHYQLFTFLLLPLSSAHPFLSGRAASNLMWLPPLHLLLRKWLRGDRTHCQSIENLKSLDFVFVPRARKRRQLIESLCILKPPWMSFCVCVHERSCVFCCRESKGAQ